MGEKLQVFGITSAVAIGPLSSGTRMVRGVDRSGSVADEAERCLHEQD
jgi:hypothetical protein